MKIEVQGQRELEKALRDAADRVPVAVAKMTKRSAGVLRRTAVAYAPISPSQDQLSKARKRRGVPLLRAVPGGLMRSIDARAGSDYVEVYVALNSAAGKYAYKMHNLRHITWEKLGVGSMAKGAQAKEKYIFRAIKDREKDLYVILQSEINKVDLK